MIKIKPLHFFLIITISFVFLAIYLQFFHKRKSPSGVLILHGHIEGKIVDVSSKIGGRIEELFKDESDKVKKGDLLALIEVKELKTKEQAIFQEVKAAKEDIRVTKAKLEVCQAKLAQAKKDLQRFSQLFKKGLISKKALEDIELAYTSLEKECKAEESLLKATNARYKQALARLKEIKIRLSEREIKSPIYGVVLSRFVEPGEIVTPGRPLFSLVNLNKLYVKIYIPEPDLGKIKLGAPARVYVDAYKNKFFQGKLSRISQEAEFTPKNVETKEERVRLVFEARVSVENPEGLLKPGMPADVVLKLTPEAKWVRP